MFEKRLKEIGARKLEIRKLLEDENNKGIDLQKLEEELRALEEEKKELEKRKAIAEGIQAGAVQARNVATFGVQKLEDRAIDKYDTAEYRKAFMEYVTRGVKSDVLEYRDDATTGTSDISAVIPTTILNRIVEKMSEAGIIWNRVTKTAIQGGVKIPVATAKPTASWVTPGNMAEKQNKQVTGTITFSYHKLQVRVAVELVAATVALPIFEATISDNIAEAMVKALDKAILIGDGDGEPLGIANDTIASTQVVQVAADDLGRYDTWVKALAKMPRSYRAGAVLIMNDADWNKYIVGMLDANGQPVARTTFGLNGVEQERFLGKEVIPIEEHLTSIDDASSGDVIAIYCRLQDYMVNSNMAITYRRYFNEDADEWISKATMIADGKLADRNGVVLIKKK